MKRNRWRIATAIIAAVALIVFSTNVSMTWIFLYNPSASAPRGWYWVEPAQNIRVSDFVVVRLPQAVAELAAERAYLPRSVPLLKHVAATAGHTACVRDGLVFIDHASIATVRTHDGAGRRLIPWPHCRTLAANEFFLLSRDSDASFDSRYFGPVTRSRILGRAVPLWTW